MPRRRTHLVVPVPLPARGEDIACAPKTERTGGEISVSVRVTTVVKRTFHTGAGAGHVSLRRKPTRRGR
jgi:hypothetical protein